MSSITSKQIKENISEGEALKQLSQIYSELSATKLNKIRKIIQSNIVFADELAGLSQLVHSEALKSSKTVGDNKTGTILMVITSNDRFYGSLENPLIRFFMSHSTGIGASEYNPPVTKVVIGKTGHNYFKAVGKEEGFEFLSFKSDLPDYDELQALSDKIKPFKYSMAFHARFKSVLSQIPNITNLSLSTDSKQATAVKQNDLFKAFHSETKATIFEPETDKILEFFDTQITKLLLENTFLEAELSRTASRMISMDQAQTNADDYIKLEKVLLGSAKRSLNNTRVLEIASAFKSWRMKKHG